nr:hypothetical protein [Tanacetum cinerariifolium]
MEDRVMPNNSQGKKQEEEDHHRNFKFSNNKMSVTACNDSLNAKTSNLVEITLFIVDSRCSKHMTRNLKLLTNFVEKFLGTIKFGNDQISPILGYGDLGNDLLIGSRGSDLYSITLQETSSLNPICLMAKVTLSQAWLWHRRLSHLNFDTINLLSKNDIVIGLPKLKFIKDHPCSSCELGKAKRKSFYTKTTPSSKTRLQLLHMDLCGPMRVESVNGKKYVLVIVDDYSSYTWTYSLRSKDETPVVLIDFLTLVQRGLHSQVRTVQTDKGTRNCTLVEAARTMLTDAKIPLFLWVEAIATACFTQNRLLIIPQHEKTPYHIINGRKPSVKFFHIFCSLCYIVRDGENLDKIKEKGNACIFVGYSTQLRAYKVFNKRTRIIVETIHVNFDELPHMASDHVSSDPVPQCPTMVLEHDSLSHGPQSQENDPHAAKTVTTSNELDLLFSLIFNKLINGTTPIVSKSSAVHAADALNKRQQHTITQSLTTTVAADTPPLNIQTTPETTCQEPTQAPTITATENINQEETIIENAQVKDDEFINIFYTPIQEQGETSSYHPLEQVIRNPSQSIRIRHQLKTDGETCMFALIVSRTELKNIKEAMADSAWIEVMKEEIQQFERLDEEVYVNQPDGFVGPYHPDQVYRLKKALYGLKQAPKACIGTSMATKHLDADLIGTPINQTKYRSMVGALMYLTASRPDIVHTTCYCARYQAKPSEKHLTAVKWIFRYTKDTIDIGIWYPKDTGFDLTAFSDSDHVGCLDSRKSTSDGIQFLDYGFHFDKIPMYCDSKAAIAISCNPVQHSRTKPIDVRYHFIKDNFKKGIVELFFVGTEYQLADLFTKALYEDRFKYLVRRLGMRCLTLEELEVLANESA